MTVKKSWLTKRLAALVLAPSVVLAGFAIALPATFTVAERANAADRAATDHTGPIGTDNDPWSEKESYQSFPRDNSLNHLSNMKSGRIALLFDFDARYTWESMGGYNFHQREQIKKYLENLKGAPVQVGIYTFDRFDRADNNYPNVAWGNTPDLPATSLENKEGFDKVMAKLDSLDATGGTRRRKPDRTDNFSNQEQGLQKVINDMKKYRYTDVFLFTTGVPNRCGVKDAGCDPDAMIAAAKQDPGKKKFLEESGAVGAKDWDHYTFDRKGVVAAALKSYELQKGTSEWPGAKLRLMHMNFYYGVNPSECPNDRERRLIEYAGYMLGKKIEYTSKSCQIDFKDIKFDNGEKLADRWITIRHAGHLNKWDSDGDWVNKHPNKKTIIEACNNWHGIGVKTLQRWDGIYQGEVKFGGGNGNQMCNHVRDGKFGQTVVNWLQKASGLAIINDQVDQDLRFIKPNAERSFKVTKDGGQLAMKKTESDGMFDLDSTDGRVTQVELAETNPTEQITPFADKYVNGQAQGNLHNARCVGWNAARKPEPFYPDNVNNSDGVPIGFKFTADQKAKYQLAKCAMYSRPLQETQIVKQAEVRNEQIRFVVGGAPIPNTKPTKFKGTRASYTFKWKCTDPRNGNREVANSDGINGKGAVPEAKRTRDINGLNVSTELPTVSLGKLPVGAKCEVTETINLPYDRDTEVKGSDAVKKRAKQLFTSENKVEGKNYQLTDTKDSPQDGQAAASKTTATVLYQKVSKGEPVSQLVSKTYYESKKAGIKLRLKITNKVTDPGFGSAFNDAKRTQATVPVYYNCRFMPDPTKPPELPEKNQGSYPGYVEVGWKAVPIPANTDEYGTEVEIGYKNGKPAWPVGAHCLFSTNVPAADLNVDSSPLNIPGFKSEDSYGSTVCNKHWDKADKELRDCGNNYFWVRSEGEQKIYLTQDFKRQYGKLEVNKLLSGEAQRQGIGESYEMNLRCVQGGESLQLDNSTAKFDVTAGTPKMVDKVPVGATCFLTETKPKIHNVNVETPRFITPDTSNILNQPAKVEVTNKFSYKKANLTVNFTSNFRDNLSDSEVQEEINKHQKKINVSCADLDGRVTHHDFTATGNAGSSSQIEVAAGSKCQISADTNDFDVTVMETGAKPKLKTYRVQVISDTVEVDVPEKGNTATINLSFLQPTAGQLSILSKVKQRPSYRILINELKQKKITAAISCEGSLKNIWSSELDLDMSNPLTIENTSMPASRLCQLKLEASWPSRVEGKTVLKIGDAELAPIENQSPMTFEFTSPAKGQGSSLVLNHAFSLAMTKAVFSLAKPNFWTSANPNEASSKVPVPDSWKEALLAGNAGGTATVPGTVNCKLDARTNLPYSVAIPRSGETIELDVPRGWECSAEVSPAALQVRGADLKSSQWMQSKPGVSATTKDYEVGESKPVGITWTPGEKPFVAALQSEHRVQLASFNLKKKVGGEGVAMIAGDRLYAVKYTCKLNNRDIQLPKPADINTPGKPALDNGSPWDAAAHLKADLAKRLKNDLDTERTVNIGRFQQGEWHPIDALPAGAVCTLEETDGGEKSSRWDNYWEITPGYRSREKESKCETASEKCRQIANGSTQKVEIILPTNQKPQENKYYDKDKDSKGFTNHPLVPENLPENFAGTMVPWNNYKFDKVNVKVTMQLEGNGTALVSDQSVNTRLYCRPPALKDMDEHLVASDANAAQVIKVPLNFKKDKDKAPDWPITMTASQQVPVNYRCILAQEDIHAGDGYVSTKIDYTNGSKNHSANTFDANQSDAEQVKTKLQELFTTKSSTTGLPDLNEYESDINLHLGENENFIAGFKVPPQVDNNSDVIDLTLTNTIQRQGVNLNAKHIMDAGTSGYYNVGSKLTGLSYKLHYECEDKYLRDASDATKPLKYTGSITLTTDAGTKVFDATSTHTEGVEAHTTRFMPASSSCQFQLQNASGDPIAGYSTVHLLTTGRVADDMKLDGRFKNEMKSTDRNPASLKVIPVVFEKYVPETTSSTGPNTAPGSAASSSDPAGTSGSATGANGTPDKMEPLNATLTFSTWYFTPQKVYTLRTYTVGTHADKVITPDTTFTYKYTCKYPNLPGHSFDEQEQNIRDVQVGKSVRLGQSNCVGEGASQVCSDNVVPEGTSCTVTGTQPQVPADKDYLKLVTNRVDSLKLMDFDAQGQPIGEPNFNSEAITNATVVDVDKQKNFTVTFRPPNAGEETPPPDDVSIGHIVYRNGAEIYVRRVDKPTAGQTTGKTVPGAKFELFYSKENGEIDTARTVEIAEEADGSGKYKATLAPGTYWLGTTNTGKGNQTELLWQRYKFTVKPTEDNACANTDTIVTLAPETVHSGLVDLTQRQLENKPTDPGTTTTASGSAPGTADPTADQQEKCTVNAAKGFTQWDVDVADIRFGALPLTGGRLPWLLGAAGLLLAGAAALLWRERRRDVDIS